MTAYATKQESAVVRERKQVIVDRELDRLYEKNKKKITADIVVDAARDPRNPLHKYFDWDDSTAAQKWRHQQAFALIQSSKLVVIQESDKPSPPRVIQGERPEVRRLVSSFRGEGFKMRTEALADEETRAVIVERAMSRLRGWCDSVVDIPELAQLRTKILREIAK